MATQRKPRDPDPLSSVPSLPTQLHLTRASFSKVPRALADVLDPLDRLVDHFEKFPRIGAERPSILITEGARAQLLFRCRLFTNLHPHLGKSAAADALVKLPLFYRDHALRVA